MELQPLSLDHKNIIKQYISQDGHELSAYAFESVYVWRCLFDIQWGIIKEKLYLFFKNEGGCFMILPPLGGLDEGVVEACFEQMEAFNHNVDLSRIENIEERDLSFFKERNFRIFEKSRDYMVERLAVASYVSQKYKAKRALYNFFTRNYRYCFRDYNENDYGQVGVLYANWAKEKAQRNHDGVYGMLLKDNASALKVMLENYSALDVKAKVVEVDGRLCGFTSGFSLSPDIFCVNFEFCDGLFKGLPQFIFAEFARSLAGYSLINMMDDCGIDNLRWTKSSFHPVRTPVSYTALLA